MKTLRKKKSQKSKEKSLGENCFIYIVDFKNLKLLILCPVLPISRKKLTNIALNVFYTLIF